MLIARVFCEARNCRWRNEHDDEHVLPSDLAYPEITDMDPSEEFVPACMCA